MSEYFKLQRNLEFVLQDGVIIEDAENLPELLAQIEGEDFTTAESKFRTAPQIAGPIKGLLGLMRHANTIKRRRRNRRFEESLARHPERLLMVAEGDSWFLYPWKLKDTIEHLLLRYNVYSVGAAGDQLEEMFTQQEYRREVERLRPSFLLLSGGGNDILDDPELKRMLRPFDANHPNADDPKTWIKEEYLEKRVSQLLNLYDRIFADMTRDYPSMAILVHGYDYAQAYVDTHGQEDGLPPFSEGKWISGSMEERGIHEAALQEAIVRVLIDVFNERMSAFVKSWQVRGSNIHLLDLRGTLTEHQWANEIHPNTEGFQQVALKFEEKIEELAKKMLA